MRSQLRRCAALFSGYTHVNKGEKPLIPSSMALLSMGEANCCCIVIMVAFLLTSGDATPGCIAASCGGALRGEAASELLTPLAHKLLMVLMKGCMGLNDAFTHDVLLLLVLAAG